MTQFQRRLVVIVANAVLAVAVFAGLLFHIYSSLRDERVALTRSQAVELLSSFEQHALRLFDFADSQLRSSRYYYLKYGPLDPMGTVSREAFNILTLMDISGL